MEKVTASPKFYLLKFLFALLPALLLMQNCAWMTLNRMVGVIFLVLYAVVVWSVWKMTVKEAIITRLLRLTEIAFFIMPISSLILTSSAGSIAVSTGSNDAEKAGAAIGTALAGGAILIFTLVIGLIGGLIIHLIANRYERKLEKLVPAEGDNTTGMSHGVLITLGVVIVLTIFANSVAETPTLNSSSATYSSNSKSQASQPTVSIFESCQDFLGRFRGDKYSELQKNDYFDKSYKGKYVRWSGEVSDVTSGIFGNGPKVTVKCFNDTLFADINVTFRANQTDKLLSVSKGSEINFTAKLDSYGGTFLYPDLSDAIKE